MTSATTWLFHSTLTTRVHQSYTIVTQIRKQNNKTQLLLAAFLVCDLLGYDIFPLPERVVPPARNFRNLFNRTYQSSHVDAYSGRCFHLILACGMAFPPFFTNLLSNTTSSVISPLSSTATGGSLEKTGVYSAWKCFSWDTWNTGWIKASTSNFSLYAALPILSNTS